MNPLSMFNLLSPATSPQKAAPLAKAAGIFIAIQILFFIFCPQGVKAQKIADPEIVDLGNRLKATESELIRGDAKLDSWDKRVKTVKNEIEKLREEPKGFLSRLAGIFTRRKRKLEMLHSELLDLSNNIGNLQNKRKLLVSSLVTLADELIDKSDSRMRDLMEVVRNASSEGDLTTKNAAEKLVSELWQLAETTRESRNRYAPPPLSSEPAITFPPLRSDDPEDIRLGIAILNDAAAQARIEAAKLKGQFEELQRKRGLLESSMEIRRSNEERGIMGVEAGNAPMPWGIGDADMEREIDEIGKEMKKLSDKMEEKRAAAERFEKQIEEKRTSQIDAESEDDQ